MAELGDQAVAWVEEHLRVDLEPWQAKYVRDLYGTAGATEA